MLDIINGAKLTWGGAAIVASLGSRFIIGDLTPAQQAVLRHPVFKRCAIFCMLFLPTRDVLLAAALTVVVCIVLEHFCNENSEWCMIPASFVAAAAAATTGPVRPPSPQSGPVAVPLPIASRAPIMGPRKSLMRGGAGGGGGGAKRVPPPSPHDASAAARLESFASV